MPPLERKPQPAELSGVQCPPSHLPLMPRVAVLPPPSPHRQDGEVAPSLALAPTESTTAWAAQSAGRFAWLREPGPGERFPSPGRQIRGKSSATRLCRGSGAGLIPVPARNDGWLLPRSEEH